MAVIKMSMEAQIADETMKKFIEVIEKLEKPIKEVQVEVSNVSGRVTVRIVPAEEEKKGQ